MTARWDFPQIPVQRGGVTTRWPHESHRPGDSATPGVTLPLDSAEAHPLAAEWASPQGPGVGWTRDNAAAGAPTVCTMPLVFGYRSSTGRAPRQPSKVLALLRLVTGGRPSDGQQRRGR